MMSPKLNNEVPALGVEEFMKRRGCYSRAWRVPTLAGTALYVGDRKT
jgi:hypothetical protein